jgi:hypothetical protein
MGHGILIEGEGTIQLTSCLSIHFAFYIENDAEIFPAHYTWKVAEKGFKMALMMN